MNETSFYSTVNPVTPIPLTPSGRDLKMSVSSFVEVNQTTRIKRHPHGYTYRAIVSLDVLYDLLHRSVITYSPYYQRGMSNKKIDPTAAELKKLYPIDHEDIQIFPKKRDEIAVKFLMGVNDAGKSLFNNIVTWNARLEPNKECDYSEEDCTLKIYTKITIPDSAHRHAAYYQLGMWQKYPEEIPRTVIVDHEKFSGDQIQDWLGNLDLAKEQVNVEIFHIAADQEGRLYDELNADQSKPSPSRQVTLNMDKNPQRRIVRDLLGASEILSESQIETQKSTIGKASRKLVTSNTLVKSFEQEIGRLIELEDDQLVRDDFLEFACEFLKEWANFFDAFKPKSTATSRHKFRETSYAAHNIIFFPLVRIMLKMHKKYCIDGKDWRKEIYWKDVIARLAGDDKKGKWKGPVFSKDNPNWQGGITTKKTSKTGVVKWSVSSTRDTREFAFGYLSGLIDLS